MTEDEVCRHLLKTLYTIRFIKVASITISGEFFGSRLLKM